MKKKLVSIVLNSFVNDNRVLKEAISLNKVGFDVTVSALELNGESLEEKHDDFKVRRIRIGARALPRGKFFGAVKYAELVLKTIWRYRKYQIWHCNDFEPLVIASLLKFFKRNLVIIYDAHEYAREKNGLGSFEKRFVAFMEPKLIGYCNEVITVSQGIAEEYQRLYDLPEVHVVFNAPHKREKVIKVDRFRERFGIGAHKVIFLYQGKFHAGRGMELLVESFKLLQDTHAELVFMGNGNLQEYVEQAAQEHDNIHLHPAVPYEEIVEHTASADFGLLTVENVCLSYYYCMPNKMFEYIQAGIPIITTNLYDCRIMVEEEDLGVVIPEFTPESFAETFRKVLEADKSEYIRAIEHTAQHFHWDNEEKKLISLYNKYL
ncbi:MAG: glycosyltransferase involved in cell wall biosynthesis [Flavobacteriales bacterium]